MRHEYETAAEYMVRWWRVNVFGALVWSLYSLAVMIVESFVILFAMMTESINQLHKFATGKEIGMGNGFVDDMGNADQSCGLVLTGAGFSALNDGSN